MASNMLKTAAVVLAFITPIEVFAASIAHDKIAPIAAASPGASAPRATSAPDQMGAQRPVASEAQDGGASLSERLDRSNGVIAPEGGVDPTMLKPAPETDPMPVIRPPDATDEGSDVQPK
jgi:hypothetical protein